MTQDDKLDAESLRLAEEVRREKNWKRWGPYLAERQWGTVREDYSSDGSSWDYFPHDHARSRAYRWGEDGILGICDREGRLCFSLAMWNGVDAILKERLFGLTGSEANHGEDVKEYYFYTESTPTHSYMKGLYKYPIPEFPDNNMSNLCTRTLNISLHLICEYTEDSNVTQSYYYRCLNIKIIHHVSLKKAKSLKIIKIFSNQPFCVGNYKINLKTQFPKLYV